MTARPKICIDRVLPRDLMRMQRTTTTTRGIDRAIAMIGKPWINGTTLHVRFMGGSQEERAVAREQAEWWSDRCNIKFAFDDALNAQIRIKFDPDDGAWSYVGTDCRSIPLNEATMNLGFLDGGTAAHEFGHAIGLSHEHQNPDGGIAWREDVVIAELAKSPNFWTEEETRHNVLHKYQADQIMGTQFDPDSIMLYFFPGTWTVSGVGTKANEVLSRMDEEFVAGTRMYPKDAATASDAVVLKVNAERDKASIGKSGEEDLFKFIADVPGRYVISTAGKTDVVMKLFGPNSDTDVIAEDDDSGTGTNARIAADLIPGNFFVQIRHFNTAGGVGEYSIGVRRM